MYYVEGSFEVRGNSRTELEEHADAVMDALLDLELDDGTFRDPSVGVVHSERRVDVDLYVDALDVIGAAAGYLTAVRAAIHAAGGGTPGWDRLIDTVRVGTSRRSTDALSSI